MEKTNECVHYIYVNMLSALWLINFFFLYFREFKIMIGEPPHKKMLIVVIG